MSHPAASYPVAGNGGNRQGFATATPLNALSRAPAPVDCPTCGERAMTTTKFKVGNSNHGWGILTCCFCCLGCIPYLLNSLKNVQHSCGHCGTLLATWHRSGAVDVHQHKMVR